MARICPVELCITRSTFSNSSREQSDGFSVLSGVDSSSSDYEEYEAYDYYDHYLESGEERSDPLASLKSKLKMEKPMYRGKPVDKERFRTGQ